MTDGLQALRELLAPATQTVTVSAPPPIRKNRCGKCPFGGEDLTPGEADGARTVRAQVGHRLSQGENVVWGCHETTQGSKPMICAGFVDWCNSTAK